MLAHRRLRRRTQGRHAAARGDAMTTSMSQPNLLEQVVFKAEFAPTNAIGSGARKPRVV